MLIMRSFGFLWYLQGSQQPALRVLRAFGVQSEAYKVRGGMNRIFGFFKEKLIEAKEQNQAELQQILNAIEFQAYSQARMLNYLQEIKTNYLEWNIMIANEASTGLYYTQIHNRTAISKKLKAKRESEDRVDRNQIVLGQMRKTLRELRDIEKLNYQWANGMNERVGQLEGMLSRMRSQREEKGQEQQVGSKKQEEVVVQEQTEQEQEQEQEELPIGNETKYQPASLEQPAILAEPGIL